MILKPEPLSRAAFAPYGDVIDADGADHFAINQGTSERFHDLAKVDVSSEGGRPAVSILVAQPRPLPLKLEMVERHPLGSQAFIPLDGRDFVVIVADPEQPSSPHGLKAFLARAGQGINYHRGTWHHPLLPLTPGSRFLVIDRGGEGKNLEEAWLPQDEPIVLELD